MRRKFKKIRSRRFRKRKSILKRRIFWNFVLIFILAFFVFYFLFFTEIFKIKEIQILTEKENLVLRGSLESVLKKELNNSFFLISSKKIEEKILKDYPEIKEVNLKKKFPKTLILEVKTRKAVDIWCFKEDNCFLIDREGVIFGEGIIFRGPISEDLMTIFSRGAGEEQEGEQIIAREKMNQLLDIQNKLEKDLEIDLEKFTFSSGERLDVKTIEGWEIYFDLSADINLALTKLSLLLEKEIFPEERKNLNYIDLRFSKVFYK